MGRIVYCGFTRVAADGNSAAGPVRFEDRKDAGLFIRVPTFTETHEIGITAGGEPAVQATLPAGPRAQFFDQSHEDPQSSCHRRQESGQFDHHPSSGVIDHAGTRNRFMRLDAHLFGVAAAA